MASQGLVKLKCRKWTPTIRILPAVLRVRASEPRQIVLLHKPSICVGDQLQDSVGQNSWPEDLPAASRPITFLYTNHRSPTLLSSDRCHVITITASIECRLRQSGENPTFGINDVEFHPYPSRSQDIINTLTMKACPSLTNRSQLQALAPAVFENLAHAGGLLAFEPGIFIQPCQGFLPRGDE